MTRKFLFCFPLRLGNIIFGYIIIIVAIAVMAFNLYNLGLSITSEKSEIDEKFANFENLDSIFGKNKRDVIGLIVLAYYSTYVIIAFLIFLFACFYTCGAYRANSCLIATFFGYCCVHLFLTIGLVVWEALSCGWLQLGLILAADLVLILCLCCGVNHLMEAIRTGHVYSQPGEVYHKY